MLQCLKKSLFSLAFLAILPLAAMQEGDLPEWKRGPRAKPLMQNPAFAPRSRTRSRSNNDGALTPIEKKHEAAVCPNSSSLVEEVLIRSFSAPSTPVVPRQANTVLFSVSAPPSPASSRHEYTRAQLMAFAAGKKASDEVLKSIKKFNEIKNSPSK